MQVTNSKLEFSICGKGVMRVPDFITMKEVNVSLLLFSAMVAGFLLFGVVIDRSRNILFTKYFIRLLIVDIIMQVGEAGIHLFNGSPERIPLLKLCCVLSFGAGSLLFDFFTRCLIEYFREKGDASVRPAYIMETVCGIFFMMVVISVFNGMFFTVDNEGRFADGPLGFVVILFDLAAFGIEMGLILWYRKLLSIRELVALLVYSIFPMLSMVMVNIWYPTPEYLMTTLSLIVLFILFHRELVRQLSKKEKTLLQKDLELSRSRISLLMSQIEPHFLFNSLSTIKYLCRTEPQMAMEALDEFSGFLRGSMDALTQNGCITFEREMKFVNSYLYLEKKRFGDRLQVVFDIQAKGFSLPALSIQTIAENAVRHGILKKMGGGTLMIAAWEDGNDFKVSVTDDGVGFEEEEEAADGKNHVGLCNVRSRLSLMCGGRMEIHSSPDKGTQVILSIPKDRKVSAEERGSMR